MEKFALLNLLKAIDGLKKAQSGENPAPDAPPPPSGGQKENGEPRETRDGEMPNLMYQTLMRHEQMSFRLRNKK